MSNTTPEQLAETPPEQFQEQPDLDQNQSSGDGELHLSPDPAQEVPEEQAKFGEAQTVNVTTNIYQRILALVVNLLLIVQLFIAMYFAAQSPDRFQPEFFSWFFRMLIPTLIGAYIVRRMIKARCK